MGEGSILASNISQSTCKCRRLAGNQTAVTQHASEAVHWWIVGRAPTLENPVPGPDKPKHYTRNFDKNPRAFKWKSCVKIIFIKTATQSRKERKSHRIPNTSCSLSLSLPDTPLLWFSSLYRALLTQSHPRRFVPLLDPSTV